MLKVKQFQFNMFGVNTYIVWNPNTLEAVVVDPGMIGPHEQRLFDRYIEENSLNLTMLINTHLHIDHLFGDSYVKTKYHLSLKANVSDAFLGERVLQQARMFGLPEMVDAVVIDNNLSEEMLIEVCGEKMQVYEVPGHSPGSIALYFPMSGILFTGDALFKQSIGRTDLVGGDYSQLINSITNKLLTLPSNTIVYPGHGPITTIGDEQLENPFL